VHFYLGLKKYTLDWFGLLEFLLLFMVLKMHVFPACVNMRTVKNGNLALKKLFLKGTIFAVKIR
jgi:hypothetical protein